MDNTRELLHMHKDTLPSVGRGPFITVVSRRAPLSGLELWGPGGVDYVLHSGAGNRAGGRGATDGAERAGKVTGFLGGGVCYKDNERYVIAFPDGIVVLSVRYKLLTESDSNKLNPDYAREYLTSAYSLLSRLSATQEVTVRAVGFKTADIKLGWDRAQTDIYTISLPDGLTDDNHLVRELAALYPLPNPLRPEIKSR